MQQVRAKQLAEWLADESRPSPVLLDVREPWEIELCQLAGSQNIPMHLVPVRCAEIDPEQDIVVVCHHGGRSMQVAQFLQNQGFSRVANIAGGIHAWADEVDNTIARY